MRTFAAVVAALFLAVSAAAETAPATDSAVVIRAARMFDGTSDNVVTPGVLIVQGGKIVAAGSSATIPAGARVIDLGDATIVPGFIDAHTHIATEGSENFYRDFFEGTMRLPAEQAHWAALYAKRTLEAGFTTIRVVGTSDYLDVGLRNAINAGITEGPRMIVAAHAISATGGHGDNPAISPDRAPQLGPLDGICNGADQCRAAVRYQIKYGADVIKFMPSGGVLSLSDPVDAPELSQDEMNAIVEEAHHWGRKVAAHCHGDLAAKMAIRAGVDSIEHGAFLQPDTLQSMKDKGIYLVPTLLAFQTAASKSLPPQVEQKAKAALAARDQMFRNALKLGVKIAFGTDSGVSRHGDNAKEFGLMTSLGMSPAAALRAGTSVAATLLGVEGVTGTLQAGKSADVVAVPGNPLQDISVTMHPLFVMKQGQVFVSPR